MKRLVIAVLLAGCGGDKHVAPAPDAAVAKIAHDAGVIADAGPPRYIGVITASELVDVAPAFDGVLESVLVRPGDHVTANQIVAEMDPGPVRDDARAAEAALSAAGAALRQAEVDVEDARHHLAIEKASVAAGTSPQQNLEQAQLAVKRAEAASQRASSTVSAERARVQIAHDRMERTSLRTPFAGTVQARNRDPGSTIGAGTPVVRVVGQGDLRLRFAVPPDQASALAPGGTVHATIETVATPVPATIRQITPTIDAATGMVVVEAELAADPKVAAGVRPGLAAWVEP